MDSISGTQVAGGIFGVLYLILTLYALIDALRKPSQAYEHAGVSKGLWVILLVLSLFIPCGIFLTLWWLFSTGPRVSRQAQIGGIGFPDGRMHH